MLLLQQQELFADTLVPPAGPAELSSSWAAVRSRDETTWSVTCEAVTVAPHVSFITQSSGE